MLMIEAVRSFSLAARFVSGYLAVPMDGPEETPTGSTHAWVQVYLPGAGWIDFDPTNGTVGKNDLITVAVVRDPRDALPLHGTFLGFPSDHLGRDVEVSVSQAPAALSANLDASLILILGSVDASREPEKRCRGPNSSSRVSIGSRHSGATLSYTTSWRTRISQSVK